MKKYLLHITTTVVSILLSLFFYSKLPESMASHWNIDGNVDGYSSRLFNVLFFPILNIFLFLLFLIVPKIDPNRKNILKFEKYFNIFILAMLSFMVLLQLQAFLWNVGIQIPMNIVMPALMGVLWIFAGQLIKKSKQNYTIGIRTPWTLHSTNVWEKTHKLGAKLFIASGILSILSAFLPKYSFYVVIGSVLISTIVVFLYSYLEFKKEKK